MEQTKPITLYFGGALFTQKELIGNRLLGKAIESASKGRYQCNLPQNLQQMATHSSEIKNNDLQEIINCDGCLINLDGNELDSGTVVELIAAKFLDKPCVAYRTDFRGNNSLGQPGSWNLMCQNYPRMECYRQTDLQAMYLDVRDRFVGDYTKMANELTYMIAEILVEKLDQVFLTPPTPRPEGITDQMQLSWYRSSLQPHQSVLNESKMIQDLTETTPLKRKNSGVKTIFFSGCLFCHKDLIGNLYLSRAIKTLSKGVYKVILSQDLQGKETDAIKIKNNNLTNIRKMDGIMISFDGPELDAGTVVEFITAKVMDKPTVIYRTDFRSGGDVIDGMETANPWNLMCSNYPRTEIVGHDAIISMYQELILKYPQDHLKISQDLTYIIAEKIVQKLDLAFASQPTTRPEGLTDDLLHQWYKLMYTPTMVFF